MKKPGEDRERGEETEIGEEVEDFLSHIPPREGSLPLGDVPLRTSAPAPMTEKGFRRLWIASVAVLVLLALLVGTLFEMGRRDLAAQQAAIDRQFAALMARFGAAEVDLHNMQSAYAGLGEDNVRLQAAVGQALQENQDALVKLQGDLRDFDAFSSEYRDSLRQYEGELALVRDGATLQTQKAEDVIFVIRLIPNIMD